MRLSFSGTGGTDIVTQFDTRAEEAALAIIRAAFPSDLTSVALTVATQAQGTILMFEKMFENRLFFTDKLVSMGARIILCDPHRAVVTGPAKLRGQRMESPDIRAGMAMLLASLCAEGSSTIGAVYQIDKGYERIDERLRALGAQIDRVDG